MAERSVEYGRTDFLTGMLFLAIGLTGAAIAWTYPLGTAGRMGPGYFPLAVSLLLTVVGAALCLLNRAAISVRRIALRADCDPGGAVFWRALAVVMASIGSFALMIERLGLAITAMACVSIAFYGARSLMAEPGARWEGIAIALGLTVFSILAFVYGVGIPMQVWPR